LEQRVWTQEQAKGAGDPGGDLPACQINEFTQSVQKPHGLSAVAGRDGGQRFGEDAARALPIVAKEFAAGDLNPNGIPLPR
jgi:hypothetical protein